MSFEELRQELSKLYNYAQEMTQIMQSQSNRGQVRPGQPPVSQNQAEAPVAPMSAPLLPPAVTGPAQAPVQNAKSSQPQLNAANLQLQQAELERNRAAKLQNSKNPGSKAPAAPTTANAPTHLGAKSPRGQGVPKYPQKNELTQDKLVLPPAKKRRPNKDTSAAGTPVAMTPGSQASPAAAKIDSPEAYRQPTINFKCQVPKCNQSPFASKAQLDKHLKQAHPPKEENITDPVGYVLESLRIALNLDDSGKSKLGDSKDVSVGVRSESLKKESGTPTAKTVNGLRTPQASKGSPLPETKSNWAQGKAVASQSKQPQSPDSWSNTSVSRQWFMEAFRDVAELNRPPSGEFLTSWLVNSAVSPPLSPPATNLTDDQSSPHKSDISATDNLNIKIDIPGVVGADGKRISEKDKSTENLGDSWLPSAWFDNVLHGDLSIPEVDGFAGMDWENALGSLHDEAAITGPTSVKKEDLGPSEEWLKAYAPEKLAAPAIGLKKEKTPGAVATGKKR